MELPTRNLESLNSFKSLINTKNTNVPAHYYVGCRLGQILHARLCMNCSALNAHLFIRNLVESSNCICGITEIVVHFLLDCPRHTTLRDRPFNLQGGMVWFFVSFRIFFSDNTRVRIFIFLVAQSTEIFFQKVTLG